MKQLLLFFFLCLFLSIPIGATEIQAASVEGFADDTVSVPVTLTDNPGFAGFNLQISYDKQQLQFTGVTKGALLQSETSVNLSKNLTSGSVQWINTETTNGDGTLFTLQFKILPNTQYQKSSVSVSLVGGKAKNFTNLDLDAIPCTFIEGAVACRTGDLLVKDWALKEQAGQLCYTLLDAPKNPVQVITALYSKEGQMKSLSSTHDILTTGQTVVPLAPAPGETVKVFFLNTLAPLCPPLIHTPTS